MVLTHTLLTVRFSRSGNWRHEIEIKESRMPFIQPLKFTAPRADPNLLWPIEGLSYVISFMGPLSAGPMIGVLIGNWSAAAVGLLAGVVIVFLNAWWTDRFVDSWVARFQGRLQKGAPRILVNIIAFAWAIILCALAMFVPIAVLGSSIFTKVP